jgi:hypothetical protein
MNKAICGVLFLLVLAGTPLSAQTINTIGGWNGTTYISTFGIPNTQTYGQLVTVPNTAGPLESFSFELNVPSTLAFRGEVYAWDGSKATGPSLFESPVTSTSGSGFQKITFNTGGLSLTPGNVYVLFATSSLDNAGHSGSGTWGSLTNNTAYPGGQFVFINNGTNTAQWTTTNWSSISQDLAFEAVFTPTASIPTLSGWGALLLSVGLALAAMFYLTRRQHTL